jgi:integrase
MRRQRQLGTPVQEDVTLAEFMEIYWELHAVPNLATSTRASYKSVWSKHVLARLGSRYLRELTPKVLTRFRVDLEKAEVGTATVRKSLALVQSILTFAVVEERVEFNAAAAVRKPRYRRAREPVIFLPDQVEAIRAQLGPMHATLVSVLAYAGPRPEEALRLTWTDVGTEALHFVDTSAIKSAGRRYWPRSPLTSRRGGWRRVGPPRRLRCSRHTTAATGNSTTIATGGNARGGRLRRRALAQGTRARRSSRSGSTRASRSRRSLGSAAPAPP